MIKLNREKIYEILLYLRIKRELIIHGNINNVFISTLFLTKL